MALCLRQNSAPGFGFSSSAVSAPSNAFTFGTVTVTVIAIVIVIVMVIVIVTAPHSPGICCPEPDHIHARGHELLEGDLGDARAVETGPVDEAADPFEEDERYWG